MEHIESKKNLASLFQKIYEIIKNPIDVTFESLEKILFEINCYNLDLLEKFEIDENNNKINIKQINYPYDNEVKIYLAERLLTLEKKLPINLFEEEGYYASHEDLDLGYKSYHFDEQTTINEINEKIELINYVLRDWILLQVKINPFFWHEDEEYKLVIPPKIELVEVENTNKITVEALVLFLKYLDKSNIISLSRISQDNTAKACLFSMLTSFSTHTLRTAFGKNIDKLNTPANLKKLHSLLDNQSFQSNFKSVYNCFITDYNKIM